MQSGKMQRDIFIVSWYKKFVREPNLFCENLEDIFLRQRKRDSDLYISDSTFAIHQHQEHNRRRI